jgi:hypothetical protein
MTGELRSPDLSIGEVKALQTPLALDLVSIYTVIRDDCMALVNIATREGWRPEDLVKKLPGLLGIPES